MPLVGIDCRFGATLGGLGTYTRSLVSALLKRNDPWSTVLFVKDVSEPWLSDLPKEKASFIAAPFDHYSLQEQIQFPNVLQDARCNLLLFPHFNVPLFSETPFLCTVHDLILHQFPNESSFWKRRAYAFVLSQALRRAVAVSVVSAFTRDDVQRTYGARVGKKLSVISPGVDASFVRASQDRQVAVRKTYNVHLPFFLYIGNAKEHKNVQGLIDAFMKAALPHVELVLVTGGREAAKLRRSEGVRVLADVSQNDLPALLSAALACVTATKMEGFCLPVAEAMACGTPVIAPAVGPLPEVTGGNALLFDPAKNDLSEMMRLAVLHPIDRDMLHAAAMHVRRFTWQSAAEKTALMMREALPN